MKTLSARSIRVTGHVQGVFFRDRTKAKAEELDVTGWVKNTDDGAVEIHAEGSEEALKELVAWCRQGPPAATVEKVTTKDAALELCEKFEIVW